MSRPHPHAIRAALAISAQFTEVGCSAGSLFQGASMYWSNYLAAQRRLTKATHRGWRGAAQWCQDDLAVVADLLAGQVKQASRQPAAPAAYTFRDILLDLNALEREFDEVTFNLRGKSVSVTTLPIELTSDEGETIDLGRFEITLKWPNIGAQKQTYSEPPYTVTALDPNPASSGDTPHPHLAGSVLCEGEGRPAIRTALSAGRVLDFFVLVRQILATYNPSSAYCELERWHGVSCADCGDWMPTDERYDCEGCNADACRDCLADCVACRALVCSGCRRSCSDCDEPYCQECFTNIADVEDRCEACYEAHQPTPPQTPGTADAKTCETKATTQAAQAPPEPLCVGQASLPA